jgi:hypothetical protein
VPRGRGPFSQHAALNIMRQQHERTDVVSELLKALRYRYELNERVLFHHAKWAADAMIVQALDYWSDAVWLQSAASEIGQLERAEDLIAAGNVEAIRKAVLGAAPEGDQRERLARSLDADRQRRLEPVFLDHGDDGLLEEMSRLRDHPLELGDLSALGPLVAELRGHAAELATDLLARRLFRIAGGVGLKDAPAEDLYRRFGKAKQRMALQDGAQGFAELGRGPHVLIWLPSPRMRIKLASVLVDDGQHINHFNNYEDVRGRRGDDIYRADRALWRLWVFTRPTMPDDDAQASLVYLADRLGVAWETLRERYGPKSWTWLPRYGLTEVLGVESPLDPEVEALVGEAVQVSRRERNRDGQAMTRSSYRTALRRRPAVRRARNNS